MLARYCVCPSVRLSQPVLYQISWDISSVHYGVKVRVGSRVRVGVRRTVYIHSCHSQMTRGNRGLKSAARADLAEVEERIRDVLRLDSVSSTSTYVEPAPLPADSSDVYENSDVEDVRLRHRKQQRHRASDSCSKNVRRWKVSVRENVCVRATMLKVALLIFWRNKMQRCTCTVLESIQSLRLVSDVYLNVLVRSILMHSAR